MINPRARKPPYLQVAEVLQARIIAGDLPHDERIPSEHELMAEFQIGRTTARRATAWLRDQGLIETVIGRGSYVIWPDTEAAGPETRADQPS